MHAKLGYFHVLSRPGLSDLLTLFEKHAGLVSKLIIGWGILITWGYCAFQINFFPTGLNLADGLVFVFIALGFGLLYFFWLLIGFMAVFFGHLVFTEPSSKNVRLPVKIVTKAFNFIVALLFIFFLIYIAVQLESFESFFAPCASGVLLHISLFSWQGRSPQQTSIGASGGVSSSETAPAAAAHTAANTESTETTTGSDTASSVILPAEPTDQHASEYARFRIAMVIVALFLTPTMAVTALEKILGGTFNLIGIQQNGVSLALNDDNRAIVQSISKELDLPDNSCTGSDSKHTITHHYNVLWHGLGERSLVQMLAVQNGTWRPVATMELDRAGVKVIRTRNTDTFTICRTLSSDTFFELYSDQLNEKGKQQVMFLIDELEKLKSADLIVTAAAISGYTDSLPVKRHGDSNFALSSRRAENVYHALKGALPDTLHVTPTGQGPQRPKSTCPGLKGTELRDCMAVDRRVEIQLKLQKAIRTQRSTTQNRSATILNG